LRFWITAEALAPVVSAKALVTLDGSPILRPKSYLDDIENDIRPQQIPFSPRTRQATFPATTQSIKGRRRMRPRAGSHQADRAVWQLGWCRRRGQPERTRFRMFDTAIIDQLSAPRAVGHFYRVSSSAMPASVVMPRARIASMVGSILAANSFALFCCPWRPAAAPLVGSGDPRRLDKPPAASAHPRRSLDFLGL
jgi:hypothetical protein